MKDDDLQKIAALAAQIHRLAAVEQEPLTIAQLAEALQIKPRMNGTLLTKSEQKFLDFLNARIFKIPSGPSNNFPYNHFNVHCQVALNGLFDWQYPKDHDAKLTFYRTVLSRRMDFVFTDAETGRIACAVEIDGKSHNDDEAQANDFNKAAILGLVQIPVVHIKISLLYDLDYQKAKASKLAHQLLKLFNAYKTADPLAEGAAVQQEIDLMTAEHSNKAAAPD